MSLQYCNLPTGNNAHERFPTEFLVKVARKFSGQIMLTDTMQKKKKTGQFYLSWVVSSAVINSHLPSGPAHPDQLAESISSFRGVWCTFSFSVFFE